MNVFLQVADSKYGSQLPNGSWNGMIGDLINKVTRRLARCAVPVVFSVQITLT